jgi:hypothetical protein
MAEGLFLYTLLHVFSSTPHKQKNHPSVGWVNLYRPINNPPTTIIHPQKQSDSAYYFVIDFHSLTKLAWWVLASVNVCK